MPGFVCHDCVGDAYLKAEIKKETSRQCMICGNTREATDFDALCERIHEIISAEFERTASEPEYWPSDATIDWERDGEPVDAVLQEILECNNSLIAAVKEELSDRYHSFEDAKMGEEDPYGDEIHYKLGRPDDRDLRDGWSEFQSEIRTRSRFFSRSAERILDGIFGDLNRFRPHSRPLIRDAGPGTQTTLIFRARRAFGEAEIARIVQNPARELGAPPSRSAGSGRMNPRWIAMFYGALDAETCIAEIRAPVGSAVVIGRFQIVRSLRLLDLEAFRHLFVDQASFFDPAYRGLRDKARFLGRLVDIMSRPVMPNDEDFEYLPTQAAAEYLAEKIEPKLDGLIFPSSQRGGAGENVVLFQRSSVVEPDGQEDLEATTSFGWSTDDDEDRDIVVWTKPKKQAPEGAEQEPQLFTPEENRDAEPENISEPALRLELDVIEVRDVQAVDYKTATRAVRRYSEPDWDSKDAPF